MLRKRRRLRRPRVPIGFSASFSALARRGYDSDEFHPLDGAGEDFATVALIQALVWLVVGAAFLTVPRQWVAPFGTRMDATSDMFGRLLGSAFLGFAVLCWLGRETDDAAAQQAIVWANLVLNGLAAVVHGRAAVRGEVINARGWGLVALTGILAVVWAVVSLT
jgi:hypothetical protein